MVPGPAPQGPGPVEYDPNGCPIERRWINGEQVVIHYDDIPECDLSMVDGIPCTSAVRTVIDLAPELSAAELDEMVRTALRRRLFTVAEMNERLAADDMRRRGGAVLVRKALVRVRAV